MRGHDWAAIRDAYPLSGVVGAAGVRLKKEGREYKACCPFHNEKTPSFSVNDEKGAYYCFGCGANGDVVDFVAQLHDIDTAQAVARLTGGSAPRMTEEDRAAREAWLREETEKKAREQREATAKARQRWERALPLEGHNAYLEMKGIAPYGCRVEGENLLVPVHDLDGEIITVQSISPTGEKKFQKGAPTIGGRLNIGIPMGRTIVCEGFATGHSIYEARADQVCVAFSKQNMMLVARELVELGVHVVLAADANAETEMRALSEELQIPVVVAPLLGPGLNDFNDQAREQGIEAVRETLAQGLIDWANRPPPPPEAPFCAISFVDAMDFDEDKIERRKWIIPKMMMAGNTHILAAPGGTGKSLFTLQLAITLASGREWGGWAPTRPCKVMIINAEDDIPEQHRRIAAAKTVMAMDADLRGRILIADNPASIAVAEIEQAKRPPQASALVEQLVATIRHHAIDVLIVDPFTETFEGDENSNDEVKWAMKIWRDQIARATGAAVYLVHHVTKDSSDGSKAGSASAIRGASALVNSARFAATMFGMTKDQALALGLQEADRVNYVRYDDAKSNHSLISGVKWFEKVSVILGNGDEVGALRPWTPPLAAGLMMHDRDGVLRFLSAVNDGYIDSDGCCHDQPFIRQKKGPRWIGALIQRHLEIEDAQIKPLVDRLIEQKVLVEYTYHDDDKGADRKGLKADLSMFDTSPE